jgi:hypothetical protein
LGFNLLAVHEWLLPLEVDSARGGWGAREQEAFPGDTARFMLSP